ncbi:uridine kinase [Candidatus Dependentiae bacterium]|nr:uridine kinase [Candidatus Dependentiae bacterium]
MKNRILIGVAGGTGSGKTTVANRIGQALNEEMVIIPQDYYYKDNPGGSLEERAKINYDHPDSFDTELLISHLKTLIAGETIQTPIYDFKEHRRIEKTKEIKPAPIIILEGILIFVNHDLRSLMDFKIFVDTPSDIRLLRRIKRDMEERGRSLDSVINQYLETVRPMHIEFVEHSKKFADIIIPEGGYNEKAIDMMIRYLKSHI